ncbi:energy-coupling factor transporter transmembrane component T family protein [Olsenella massiliensis]|uniref:energy-coupling factor transporter transmembrane component T family protein n=1 Tax=Olsenella massiliensis TaxID=1622075 RepID=UPI00071DBF62|nr:energy-coupling factor transporter transmembrane component T [Olsenella massiliensis]
MSSVLDYSGGTTLLHRCNPISKMALAVAFCVATFFADSYLALVGLIALVVLLGVYAGVARRVLAMLGAFLVLACFMTLVQTLIVRSGDHVVLWVTSDGLALGTHVALRLVAFALPLMTMLAITRFSDLANAACEVLRLPYRYAFTLTTALRFVPIFTDQMERIMEAQTARGVEFDTRNPIRKLMLMLPLIAPLLISSVGKADDTALAAEERGFYLRTRDSSLKRYPFRPVDVPVLCLAVALVVVGVLF